jgi:acetyl-CoA acetyltransferase
MLAAGFPESVPVQIINRFCSSGLMAATAVANQIRSGQIEIGLAVGVESMSEKCVRSSPPLCYFSSSKVRTKVDHRLVKLFPVIRHQTIAGNAWAGLARMSRKNSM